MQQAVLRAFARHGRPPTAGELDAAAAPFGVPAGRVLAELAAADYLSLDEGGRIRAAYPFSPTPTAHQVRIADGPQVWAMCAVDALGIVPMLGSHVEIRSAAPADGREITVTFRSGKAQWQPASAVVLCPLGGACSGPAVDACCSSLNFFADAASARRWARRHPEFRGRVLGAGAGGGARPGDVRTAAGLRRPTRTAVAARALEWSHGSIPRRERICGTPGSPASRLPGPRR